MTEKELMEAAVNESRKSMDSGSGGPFGAVIARDGKIVGRGHNQVLENNDPTAHAEMQAIRSACSSMNSYDLAGCRLYTSCYPCPMCMAAAIWANIEVIVYGNTRGDAADIGFRDDNIYNYIEEGCRDEDLIKLIQQDHELTIKVFREFAEKEDKTIY